MKKFNTNILSPGWLVGFIDGEGSFFVGVTKHSDLKLGFQVQLQFSITQLNRDTDLMIKIKDFLECGNVTNDGPTKKQFRIRSFKDLRDKLFPLFDLYPLQTQKRLDYLDFVEVHKLMESGLHLTPKGLEEILSIKNRMNRRRQF